MLAALDGRGHDIVERLLSENESRWQSLSAADRRTVESLLLTVASRMLDRPATRIEPAQVRLLRELFALPGGADEMP
ncbi:MAG: hypothetical protein QOJ57_2049 [Thermoleophilaceae bacterium]|jgi:hypothetical protein|nr:hypothetical protein [Thermoleophilaceae bacterium]